MTKIKFLLIVLLISLMPVLSYTVTHPDIYQYIFSSKATANEVVIRVKLQGNFNKNSTPSYKTKIAFYTSQGKIKELNDQSLNYENQNIFKLQITLNDLDFNKIYDIFIKPDKYLGKVIRQNILKSGQNNIDFINDSFLSGDIQPQC